MCAAVRERMLPLVADRIAAADRRQAELAVFSARLAEVHDHIPVTLSRIRPDTAEAWRDAPVACTLDGTGLGERTAHWQRITAWSTDRQSTADGVTLRFPATPELAAELAALAAAEQDCCAFFDFTPHLAPTALELIVRAPDTAGALLTDLFGAGT